MELVIGFIILVVLVVVGVPIVFSFGAATIWFTLSLGYDPAFLMPTAYSKLNGVVLFAIPLFIMAGGIMEKGKIGGALISFVQLHPLHVLFSARFAEAARQPFPVSVRYLHRKCEKETTLWALQLQYLHAQHLSEC